jgi:UDP-3-O-[3-hydroxymyristoyl] glucosamine N-acyltransferase
VELRGDPDIPVEGVAAIDQAKSGDISFLANPRYRRYLASTGASAVVVHPDEADVCTTAALVASNPYLVFARIAQYLNPPAPTSAGIHPTAWIHPDAVVDSTAAIGPRAVVEAGARIGPRARIGSGALIGAAVSAGADSMIGANVTINEGVVIGERVVLHPGVVLGADGFGFANDQGRWVKVPQVGSVRLGNDVDIGANTTVDRGAMGDTVIEDGVKLDNLIQIGHNVRIGAHTAIAACTAVAGSVTIGRRCMIGGAVAINGHITIADGVTITGMTAVMHSIREPGVYSSGTPMALNHQWRKNAARFNQLDDLFRRLKALQQEFITLKRDCGRKDD